MQNMDEVRKALSDVYQGLKAGSLKPNVACEMNNACGKIINTVKMELEYYSLIKETPKIKFLEPKPTEEKPPLDGSVGMKRIG